MLGQFNLTFFKLINSLAGSNQIADWLAIFLAEYTPYIFIIILFYLWLKPNNQYKNIVLYTAYTAILGITFNAIIGLFYFHARPFALNLGQTLIQHNADSSFPSDHTTFILAIALMFLYFKTTRQTGLWLSLLGLLAGLSRIYVGVHFPLDITASLVVAAVTSYIIFLFKTTLQKLNQFIISLYFKIRK